MTCSRRVFLGVLGGVTVSGALAAATGRGLAAPEAAPVPQGGQNGRFAQVNGEFGWQPHTLDPRVCAPVA